MFIQTDSYLTIILKALDRKLARKLLFEFDAHKSSRQKNTQYTIWRKLFIHT